MSEQKEILRREARKHRSWIDSAMENPQAFVDRFIDSIKPEAGQVIAGYWPIGREIDPVPTMEALIERGHVCALPIIEKDTRALSFARWDKSVKLEQGAFGTLQPPADALVEPDILIAPLLAFDRRGYRLGQGGGYYDATLADLRAKKAVLAVGLAYAEQAVLFNLPREDHDEPMDWVITPQGSHYFRD